MPSSPFPKPSAEFLGSVGQGGGPGRPLGPTAAPQPLACAPMALGGQAGCRVCVVRAVPSCCLRLGLGGPGPRAVLCKDRFFNSVSSAFKYLHLALCT